MSKVKLAVRVDLTAEEKKQRGTHFSQAAKIFSDAVEAYN
jgi:hypothetical protein